MAVRGVLPATPSPPIPASRVETTVEQEPVLFWVRTGRAQLHSAGEVHALSGGEAIWIPAGVPHRITVDAGSVAFPIFPPAVDLPASLNWITPIAAPPRWDDWLVLQFAHGLGYLRGSVSTGSGLLELVAGSRADPTTRATQPGSPSRGVAPPPLPRSPAAVEVARALMRHPGDPTELREFAEKLRVGVRTLQHQFSKETGLPFVRWRSAARVAAAAAYLDAGQGAGWAGQRVGFATPAGFTRAFKGRTGRTPLEYTQSRLPRRRSMEHTLAAEVVKLTGYDIGTVTEALPAPAIPATSTWACVNDFHVIVWVYRGTARVTIGDRTWRLRRGDAMWLPAGVHNSIDIDEGSLLLPLGSRTGTSPTTAPPPRVIHFPLAAEDWLLHTVVAAYTLVRPQGFDDQALIHRVRDTIQTGAAPTNPTTEADPVRHMLVAIRDDPADARTLTRWAETLGVEATVLHERFVETTGQTFPLWRAGVRMTVARDLLDSGALPGEVSRRLGYAHPSGFTQVFTKAHGMTPRAYQLRQLRTA